MAKIAAVPTVGGGGDGILDKTRGWWERVIGFFRDVRTEMRKVTTPSLKEVRATTAVVIITVAIFGLYFFVIDNTLNTVITKMLNYFTK